MYRKISQIKIPLTFLTVRHIMGIGMYKFAITYPAPVTINAQLFSAQEIDLTTQVKWQHAFTYYLGPFVKRNSNLMEISFYSHPKLNKVVATNRRDCPT